MPDPYLTDLRARTVSPETRRAAQLACARASLAFEGDPVAAAEDCGYLLDILDLRDE